MQNKLILVTTFILIALFFPSKTEAHSGRTDSSGGHNCRTGACAGTYHYHNGGSAPTTTTTNTKTTNTYVAPTTAPKPTSVPTAQPTAKPVVTPSPVPSPIPTPSPSPSPTPSPTPTPSPLPSPSPTQEPSPSPQPEVLSDSDEAEIEETVKTEQAVAEESGGSPVAGIGVLGATGAGMYALYKKNNG